MITRTHLVAGVAFRYRVPATAADVLEWRLYCQCIEADAERSSLQLQVLAGLEWAARFVEPVWRSLGDEMPAELSELLVDVPLDADVSSDELAEALRIALGESEDASDETYRFNETVGLFNAIARSAGLPQSVLDDIVRLYDIRNGVDPAWRPSVDCDCYKCKQYRKGNRAAVNPPQIVCLKTDIDPRAHEAIARVIEVEHAGEPYYLAQVRSAIDLARGRKLQFDLEKAEAESESEAGRREIEVAHGLSPAN